MKKLLISFALILLFSTSLIAGTLAMYTTTIDDIAEGSVVAKEFILLESGTDTFTENVKIAPDETVEYDFSVKNYDGSVVSETAMDLGLKIDVLAADGKGVIAPLVVTVKNSDDETVGTLTTNGTIEFADEFELSTDGQEKTFTVSVNWPSDDDVDIEYAGANYGTALQVAVTGTQK
ncbi:MAG: hypothetical protein APF84_08785 [Gracilibacter sp. BRH_c7a]|nr:MAG: hypothetical protein APF84_08785 [Gracilibacter sp. BRH_c7a]